MRVDHSAIYVLSDKAVLLRSEEAVVSHIFEVDVSARVGSIASNNTYKVTSNRVDILKSDVSDCDSRLSVAASQQGVEHAAWAGAVWLVLLLRANVDVPPDGLNDSHVFIEDVLDDSIANMAWVGLNIDRLNRGVEHDVLEGHVSDAREVSIGRH